MRHRQRDIVSIADACLGGLRGRSALLIGPEEVRQPYKKLLLEAGMRIVFQEDTSSNMATLLPQVQLLLHMPEAGSSLPPLSAAEIAAGCAGRRTPLLIFDLASSTSVEELAGLLPAVCLYTPSDLRHMLYTGADAQIA